MKLSDLPPVLRAQAIRKLGDHGLKRPNLTPYGLLKKAATTSRKNATDAAEGGKSRKCDASLIAVNAETSFGEPFRVILTLAVNPRDLPTAQQKGVDFKHRVFFTKPKVKAWENRLAAIFSQCVDILGERDGFSPEKFCGSGIKATVSFMFSFPTSTPKSQILPVRPMLKRPDCDNLAKGVLDAMTKGGLITDDNCIFVLQIDKWYTQGMPKVEIVLERPFVKEEGL